ncbi:MAG: hypothetical protein ABL883_09835 [Terricaulis sp.]
MVSSVNSRAALAFLTSSQSGAAGIDASLLASLAAARSGIGVDAQSVGADPNAPVAPVWTPGVSPSGEALLARAFSGKAFFDTGAQLYSDLGATGDYRRLFALHTGLTTLQSLARAAEDDKAPRSQRARVEKEFVRGLGEMAAFFSTQQFEDVRMAQGDRVDNAQTGLALPTRSEDYLTGIVHRGGLSKTVSGLPADAAFEIVATSSGGTESSIAIDLSEMDALPRSLGAIVSFINSKLAAAGVASRLETVDQSPKTNAVKVGVQTVTSRYTGPKQYALKVDVRAGERIAFEAVEAKPAFYAIGQTASGARLIKLEDVGGQAGIPVLLPRPGATLDPTGANVATGWLGPGQPYVSAPANVFEQRTNALTSDDPNSFEDALRAPGEAMLKLRFADGRSLAVTSAWRGDDLEVWRARSGENPDRAMLDDLAERLSQLLHEQGVAAGVDVWEDGDERGFSLLSGDLVSVESFAVSGRAANLEAVDPAGMVGGLRDGVFARRFETASVAGASDLLIGDQTFVLTTSQQTHTITIDGGEGGIEAEELAATLNEKLRDKGLAAAASLYDDGGALTLRIDTLHDMIAAGATINDTQHDAALQAPGLWASGGLPIANVGQPFGDGVRTFDVTGGNPLLTYAGAVDLEIVVDTPAGAKTVTVSVSAAERANDPDPAVGQWNSMFQDRLDAALNAAGVYVGASGADLAHWSAGEAAGHRIASISINGDSLSLEAAAPAMGVGGAFSNERSFTSAEAASGVSDVVSAFVSDQSLAITFGTIWGERTVSASLELGDPHTLESAALRLNQALATQGYDLGVAATALSGGGAGLRMVAGGSHSIRVVGNVTLGGESQAVTLDPIDSASHADDPVGAVRVAERAGRGATAAETGVEASSFSAPSANAAGWFPGRAFDVAVGGGAKVATARAVAAAGDGSVYVLADLDGDSATSAIKGARDVALMKYDSAGKLAFTRMLGAAQSASGFALAISTQGKIAVAGSVTGTLTNTGAGGGGEDSLVTLFDSSGAEVWTKRRGAAANDEARVVAFTPDGDVVVAGRAESALGPNLAFGGADAYVRGFSAGGFELFSKQFGTVDDDLVSALLVRSDGSGGTEIFTGGVENRRGVLRRFTYSAGAGFVAGAVRDIGDFRDGAINAIAADGAVLYVGGEIGADRLSLGGVGRAAVAAGEGFVGRLDSGLVSTAGDRATYLGSAQQDAVKALAIVDGEVYAAGVAGGIVAGQGAASAKSAFLARLDDNGEAAWVRSFNSAGGSFSLSGLTTDAAGASPLDILGLPRGIVAVLDAAPLTSRTALRVGDEFRIGGDGRRLRTITIGATDSLATLVGAINRAIGAAGRAEIVREGGVERLKLSPRQGQAVRIESGREGRDALAGLGLAPSLIAVNSGSKGNLKNFGLDLFAADLKLDSKASLVRTKAELSAAVSIVRQAYDALLHPNAKEQTAEERELAERLRNAGPAPQYLNAQLANYRAALARLGG